MNTKLIFYILGITGMLFASCDKEFLDKYPSDQLSGETFWKTEKDAEMALAGVYSRLFNNSTYDHQRVNWDCLTEIGYQFSNHDNTRAIATGNLSSNIGGLVETIYNDSYKGISACNIFLKNIDNVEMNDATKTRFKSEVQFLRAMFYFTLTEFYGGVVLYTTAPTIDESKIAKSSKTEIVQQIIQDLDAAISGLPDVSYTDGHAVKGSALALKSKVLMHNERWAEAAEIANTVIQSGTFDLYDGDYLDMFLAVGQENNPELLFTGRYLNPDLNATYGPDVVIGWWNAPQVHIDFPSEFECTDGLPISSSPLYNPNNVKENRDPRMDYNVRFVTEPIVRSDGFEWSEWTNSASDNYPMFKKYVNPESVPIDYTVRSEQDYIYIRYAEVLLIYAESQNEAVGPDQSVYDAINAVRARVDMPALPGGLDQTEMRKRIQHERAVEFAGEGLRYWDIKRWKTAETIIPQVVDLGGINRGFDPSKHYLFPFPQSEVDVNKSLVQNPGY